MAVYKRDLVDINLETGNIHRSFLKHSIGYKDQQGDHFGIRAYRDGEPVNLTGISVQGVFMPPQGSPIAITTGNIVSGNEAEVVLPQACYNYDGQFTLAIKLVDSSNSVTGTVRIVDGMVDNTHASGTVAPTSAVPTYQEVLSTYEQAIAAINKTVRFDATQSLTDTQKATARINISSPSVAEMNTAVGNEATARQNADALKVNISDIENDLTGTTAGKVLDARQGKVLDDKVSDLKSALFNYNKFIFGEYSTSQVVFTKDDIAPGTTIVCECHASGTTGYLRFWKTGGSKELAGKTSATAPSDFSILYTIPSDFDYCDVYNTVEIKYLVEFNGDVTYDSTNGKFVKTLNGKSQDIVSLSTLKNDMGLGSVTADIAEIEQSLTDSEGLVFGTFETTGSVVFTKDDIPVGTRIIYSCHANGTIGYLRFHYTDGRVGNIGKTLTSDPADFSGTVVLPSDFDYCDNYNSVNVKYIRIYNGDVLYDGTNKKFIKSMNGQAIDIVNVETIKTDMGLETADTDIEDLQVVTEQLGVLSCGKFTIGTQLFSNSDVLPGTKIKYSFSTNGSVCYIKLNKSDGTSVNIGKTSASDVPTQYSGIATLPVDFTNCTVYALSDNKIKIDYIIGLKDKDLEDYPPIPNYYVPHMESKCETINGYMDGAVANGDAFVFISDQHWEDNAKHSPQMLRYLYDHTTVNKLFSGGDIYNGNHDYDYPNARAYMLQLRRTFPGVIYPCVGNHDLFKHMPTSRLAALYDMYHDDYNGDPTKHYYYVDNKRAKIRYIVLADYYESETDNNVNGFPVDTIQQQWFLNDALNLQSGWGAIIITHQCWYNASDVTTELALDSRFRDTLISYINSYSGNGEIICMIQGHTHCDRIMYTGANNTGVPVIITTCDKNTPIIINGEPDIYPSDRASGTVREQAFDVFIVNRTSRTINVVRCGCEAYDGVGSSIGDAVQVRTVEY